MRVRELIEELMKLEDQEGDIYMSDSEYGVQEVMSIGTDVVQVLSAGGKLLPKNVPVIQ